LHAVRSPPSTTAGTCTGIVSPTAGGMAISPDGALSGASLRER
jgi:hypothetical protein